MQILQNSLLGKNNTTGNSPKLNIGEILQVTVKERLNDKEAVVSMNGKTFTVKFDQNVPSDKRISIEVVSQDGDGQLQVKLAEAGLGTTAALRDKLTDVQKQTDLPVAQAIKVFADRGITLTKKDLMTIKEYLKSDDGTINEKLATLKSIAEKQIPITEINLKAVHEVMHGKSLTANLTAILSELKIPMPSRQTDFNFEEQVKKDSKDVILSETLIERQEQPLNHSDESSIERNIVTSESEQSPVLSDKERYLINEAVQNLKLNSRSVIVTEITEKLSQMAIDFKKMRQEMNRNLENVIQALDNKTVHQTNAKQIVESTIHNLDKAIKQSDFLLYADMSTEKKMISASSQLADARRLLENGDVARAKQIVISVKETLAAITFTPSDVKLKYFVSGKLDDGGKSSTKQISAMMQQTLQPLTETGGSSRQVYEMIRKLGMNHESEVANHLLLRQGKQDVAINSENLKAALLRVMHGEDVKPHIQQQAEQTVNLITGQQLLNKQDSSGVQNLFFQLPYLLEKQVENVKIFINSRKNGDKVDWENCNLVFSLETRKLGEIGVVLTASNRKVNLTFKSDKAELQSIVSNMSEVTKERFKEIGYHLNSIGVRPVDAGEDKTQKPVSDIETKESQQDLKKGFDLSI